MRPLRAPFDLELHLPGSKSVANRLLVTAALAQGSTVLRGATPCEDVERMVENLARLGFDVRWRDREHGEIAIAGGVPTGGGRATLDCGNAGTTLRFLTALGAVVPGEWTLTGVPRMRQRPIGPLVQALRELGADIEDSQGFPPVTVRGGTLRGGRVTLDARLSSQFASALELVAAAAPAGIALDVQGAASPAYLELTRRITRAFTPGTHVVEGDWSAAGAWLVLAELTRSRVRCTNLDADSAQADRRLPEQIAQLRGPGDRVVDCREMPDQLMNLAVLAARRAGATRFVGAANLRHKESDRLAVLTRELRRVGIAIDELADGVVVRPSPTLRAARLEPHGDHRMAMAFAILASMQPGIDVVDRRCCGKSYPAFFSDLARIHDNPRCVALIGMRGAGKSTLGAGLAARWRRPLVDADAEFERRHGPIRAFVETNGWDAFRAIEERLVDEALRPGRVVALGGGAVLSARTREHLRERALVVLVEEDLEVLQRRVEATDRPSLTGRDPVEELAAIAAERQPLYRSLADLVLSTGSTRTERVEFVDRQVQALCSW